MILTITLNPCVDKSTVVEKFEPDHKLRCTDIKNEPGGGGINVSKALKRLDTSSVALFPAGGHNGNMLCSLLRNENLVFHAIETHSETRENWIIFETSTQKQFRLTFPGREINEEKADQIIDQAQTFSASWIVASGSLPPGLPDDMFAKIADFANAAGSRSIIDTSGNPLKALKGRNCFLIKPNAGELGKLLNREWLKKEDIPEAARQLIADQYAENIAVSMGAEGAWLVNSDESFFVKAPYVEKKSTVGAGDSMVAGMVYQLQKGGTMKEAICFGVACGSAATMNEGTRLFDKADAEKLYTEIRNEHY